MPTPYYPMPTHSSGLRPTELAQALERLNLWALDVDRTLSAMNKNLNFGTQQPVQGASASSPTSSLSLTREKLINAERVSNSSSFLPDVDDSVDLGSASQRWRDLYLSRSLIAALATITTMAVGSLTATTSLAHHLQRMVLSQDLTVPDQYQLVVAEEFEIESGVTLDFGGDAFLEVLP